MGVDHRDLVVAHAIDVILLDGGDGVIDQKLADVLISIGKYQAAHPTLVRKVQAAIVVAGGLAIEEVQAEIVKPATGVIVDQVEQDTHAIQMKDVDQALELIGAGL